MFGGAEIMLIIQLLFFISIIGVGIYIQVKLSRSENKYLGVILPIISFLLSIIIIFSITTFTFITSTSSTSNRAEDTIEESIEITEEVRKGNITSEAVIGMFFTFLITNIPTAILGGIYINERNKVNVKKSIDKMRINDL